MARDLSSGDELKELYNHIPKLVNVKSNLAKILVFHTFTAVIGTCAILYTVHTFVNFSYVLIMEENVNKNFREQWWNWKAGFDCGLENGGKLLNHPTTKKINKKNKTTFTATEFQITDFN